MNGHLRHAGFLISAILLAATRPAAGQEEAAEADSQVRAAVKAYVTAFNAKDVDRLLAHWSPDGVYTNRETGEKVSGRDAIAAEFRKMFDDDAAETLGVETESVQLISPNVALERGVASITRGSETTRAGYRVVYVRRRGRWLIDRLTEDAPAPAASPLESLGWLVGEWRDDGDGYSIATQCNWTRNRNFISRTYTVSTPEGVESTGLQVIGWDARQQQIRSWLFDSNGSVVTGVWEQVDDHWTVQSVATLADGGRGSFTSVFRPTDDGDYGWKKINRVIDGELLPNIAEIVVRRQ